MMVGVVHRREGAARSAIACREDNGSMDAPLALTSLPVRALLLGERIDTRGLERDDTIATNPLTLRIGRDGIAFLFRYGVAVFAGLSAIEEGDLIRSLPPAITAL